jgi:2,3-diketo-5-methylthio-1-phosphopentane phosphatase
MTVPVLLFDFDNTITRGDLLDAIIERYSRDRSWVEWERAWVAGELSAPECLSLQMANLAASREAIVEFAAAAPIDEAFPAICRAAANVAADVIVVSDSFTDIISAVLSSRGLSGLRVLANELRFTGGRIEALFPYRDPSCLRCGNCKGQHVRAFHGRETIFVGDGLSDLCAAEAADVVFAKDALARRLAAHGRAYRPFDSLRDVHVYLQARGF